jgi:dTMP kinase
MKEKGLFLVVEGSDGSGKTTQFNLIKERLKAIGYEVEVFEFPRYNEPSSYFVKQYLNGAYGKASEVSPYTASLFYAMDRFEAAPLIKSALEQGKIVLADRFTGSNMAHQGGKFSTEAEKRGFFIWADGLEYSLLNIPRPDLNLFLRVPAETSYDLISNRPDKRTYTAAKHDVHEADMNHLKESVATYDLLCKLFPKDFAAIDCTSSGQLMSIPQINDLIWSRIKPLLPKSPAHKPTGGVVSINAITPVNQPEPEAKDSTSEINLNINNISFLAVLDLATHSRLDVIKNFNDKSLKSSFYSLPGLNKKLLDRYKDELRLIQDMGFEVKQKLTTYVESLEKSQQRSAYTRVNRALKMLKPLASICNINLSGEVKSVKAVAETLYTSNLQEARWLAKQLQLSQTVKSEVKRDSVSHRQTKPISIKTLIKEISFNRIGSFGDDVRLITASPKNEFSALSALIFPYTDLSQVDIETELNGISYEKKYQLLQDLLRTADRRFLNKIVYEWDVLADSISMEQLLGKGILNNVLSQPATPRYGFKVPTIVEQAGSDDLFMRCFDISLELFHTFQTEGADEFAAYTVLAGHKRRWQFNISADALFDTRIDEQPEKTYSSLINSMRRQASEVHPIVYSALMFNKSIQDAETKKKTDSTSTATHRKAKRNKNRS